MIKRKLGVNIDHVATIRNARGENYPDPLKAALIAEKCGADSITLHLREDRRHIRDTDLINIRKKIKIPLNLEMAPTNKMLKIAIKNKPDYVCIVPEKRKEVTTEGGLNLKKNKKKIKNIIAKLKSKNIRVSLFINPALSEVKLASEIRADCVELHTGIFCKHINKHENKLAKSAYVKLLTTSNFAKSFGLDVHAGHGLNYRSTLILSKIKNISEFNIGHFIISDSLFLGIKNVIKKFKNIIKN